MDQADSEGRHEIDGKRPVVGGLHPVVYKMMIACAFTMAAGVWLFAGGKGTYSLAFVAVGLFALVAAIIPSVLSRFGRRRAPGPRLSLHDWRQGDLAVYDRDPIKAPSAALLILMAPLAGAIGLVLLAVVARLATGGAL
jgi:hypothetical protein